MFWKSPLPLCDGFGGCDRYLMQRAAWGTVGPPSDYSPLRASREIEHVILSPALCGKSRRLFDPSGTTKQVAEAAASLHAQLQRFPPRAGAETRPPFTRRVRTPWFFIDWLLLVPGANENEAVQSAIEYMHWIHLEPVVESSRSIPERPGMWYVRLATKLWIRENDPFRALFQLLSHLPMPYGAPRVHRPYLRPDGVFTCTGELAPTREEAEDPFSRIRGWFQLTNHESPPPP